MNPHESDNHDGDTAEGLHGGVLTVRTKETHFGEVLRHGLDGPIIFMALPKLGGWRPFGSLCGSHQTYAKKVVEYLEEDARQREIAVLDVEAGERVTVWSHESHEPMYPMIRSSITAADLLGGADAC